MYILFHNIYYIHISTASKSLQRFNLLLLMTYVIYVHLKQHRSYIFLGSVGLEEILCRLAKL